MGKLIFQPWVHSSKDDALVALKTIRSHKCNILILEGLYHDLGVVTVRKFRKLYPNYGQEFFQELIAGLPQSKILVGCEIPAIHETSIFEVVDGKLCVNLSGYSLSMRKFINIALRDAKIIFGRREEAFIANLENCIHHYLDSSIYIGFGQGHVGLERKIRGVCESVGMSVEVLPMSQSLFGMQNDFAKNCNYVTAVAGKIVIKEVFKQRFRTFVPLCEYYELLKEFGGAEKYFARLYEVQLLLKGKNHKELMVIWEEEKIAS